MPTYLSIHTYTSNHASISHDIYTRITSTHTHSGLSTPVKHPPTYASMCFLRICRLTHRYVYTCTRKVTRTHMYLDTHVSVYTHRFIHVSVSYTHTYIVAHMSTRMYVRVHLIIHKYTHAYTHMCYMSVT